MSVIPATFQARIGAMLLTFLLSVAASVTIARDVTDATGRRVTIPDAPQRIFAAGPPANVLLYTLKPQAMVGWVRAPRDGDLRYLLDATHDLPELGRLTGRGDTLNLEVLLASGTDLIVDFGTVNDTYRSIADRVQQQAGIPYLLLDGSLESSPAAIRQLADILGVPERGEVLARYAEDTFVYIDEILTQVPPDNRPSVYLARGPLGLETAGPNSINAELIGRVGARNVTQSPSSGLASISAEQILDWAPDVIISTDGRFADAVQDAPEWSAVPAVREGMVFLSPSMPFGFIDAPPSVNRLIGLRWLAHQLYPGVAQDDLHEDVRNFYRLFYQVTLDDTALRAVLNE